MNYSTVLYYWFSEGNKKYWFNSTAEVDAEIEEKFEDVWIMATAGELDFWQDTPEGSLALIIVLDQFPLNMFRGEAKSFQTERQAIEVTLKAIKSGYDNKLSGSELSFLLMPLMHSEKLEDQDLSIKQFAMHNLASNLQFAQHHRDLIIEFGRFPHRNAILGRENTRKEIDYLASKRAFMG